LSAARNIKDTLLNMRFRTPVPVTAKVWIHSEQTDIQIQHFLSDEVLTFLSDVVAIVGGQWGFEAHLDRLGHVARRAPHLRPVRRR
jgi:hypothetical protein